MYLKKIFNFNCQIIVVNFLKIKKMWCIQNLNKTMWCIQKFPYSGKLLNNNIRASSHTWPSFFLLSRVVCLFFFLKTKYKKQHEWNKKSKQNQIYFFRYVYRKINLLLNSSHRMELVDTKIIYFYCHIMAKQ